MTCTNSHVTQGTLFGLGTILVCRRDTTGWGPPPELPEPPLAAVRGRTAGRGRGGGGRGRGRRAARGGSRGRGRGRAFKRGSGSRDDLDTDSDADGDADDVPAAAQLPQILVDVILGWRSPLSQQEMLIEK